MLLNRLIEALITSRFKRPTSLIEQQIHGTPRLSQAQFRMLVQDFARLGLAATMEHTRFSHSEDM